MTAPNKRTSPLVAPHRRRGFTLVEILVVIVIIGILMAVAIPAITIAINRGKEVSMKMEVNSLVGAVKQYEQKYGDYPPDFSDWTVVERHYRKIFPRIGAGELNRLRLLLDLDPSNDTATTFPAAGSWPAHDAVAMDRGEVLAWCLGGYSDNPIAPFTGPGGPLEEIDVANTASVTFQMNIDRNNKLYDFQPERLDFSEISPGVAMTASNRYVSSDGDLFASYTATDNKPFVYFDSRTYASFDPNILRPDTGSRDGDFNGYGVLAGGGVDIVRPYYSDNANPNTSGAAYGSLFNALAAWDFMNPDTFQIIAPGLDGRYGSVPYYENDMSNMIAEPLYFQYPTGIAVAPSSAATTPGAILITGVRGYQERVPVAQGGLGAAENFQLDNITNFSKGKIVDDYVP